MSEKHRWTLWSRGEELVSIENLQPRVASWEANADPEQIRLRSYVEDVFRRLQPSSAEKRPLYLHLDVDVGAPDRLLKGRDLENFLTPLFGRNRFESARFALVSGRKTVGGGSRLSLGIADAAERRPDGWMHFSRACEGGTDRPAWKAALRDALAESKPVALPPGSVAVQLAWRCGPGRSWSNLWKATGDAMGPVLGVPNSRQPFNPDDDRIVDLILHRNLDYEARHEVTVGMWWRAWTGRVPGDDAASTPNPGET